MTEYSGVLAVMDGDLLLALAAQPGTPYAAIMGALTWIGDWGPRLVIAFAAAGLLMRQGQRRDAVLLPAILLSGMLFVTVLKQMLGRVRPDLLPHLDIVASASFPSGHAANNMILWFAIARLFAVRPPLNALLLAVPLAIGFSRVALAVHWPSDIVAGWAIGLLWVLLALRLFRRDGVQPTPTSASQPG